MALSELNVSGYRSLRRVDLPLGALNIVTGPNGSGKSNLYRALWLIARICEGEFARALCSEGGLLSAMWAGPRMNQKPLRMSIGFRAEHFSFEISSGFPQPSDTMFQYDPEIKEEAVWFDRKRKPSNTLLERKAGMTWVRDAEGHRVEYPLELSENESALSQLRDPHQFPELYRVREIVRGWRFYHAFRTDDGAPCRSPRISVRTPVLHHDGSDLAAALQTILEIGDVELLFEMIEAAFPGRSLRILSNESAAETKSPQYMELSVGLDVPGCSRTLLARELSDGTLRFLCLVAALLSPRPPELIALNEPESSLHPDLLRPLGRLIVNASRHSQVWVSTHSRELADAIYADSGVAPIELELRNGETVVHSVM